ncbi:hypothetical protein, conserved [Angomonas deanei]|uniref:Uncharacterized protein n=1 Tax=Angomonas deanei TaxID=59799 RepID=A0A7G2C3Z6_9TRYP|nr:hypothetical protein, conserved [Angomonas deanei]
MIYVDLVVGDLQKRYPAAALTVETRQDTTVVECIDEASRRCFIPIAAKEDVVFDVNTLHHIVESACHEGCCSTYVCFVDNGGALSYYQCYSNAV